MANDFDSNFSRKLMEAFLTGFESERVLSKNVDTQLFNGKSYPFTLLLFWYLDNYLVSENKLT